MPFRKSHLSTLLPFLALLAACSAPASPGAPPPLTIGAHDGAAPSQEDAASPVEAEAAAPTPTPSVDAGGLALHVSGNQLLDASSHPVRLLGVNRSGSEFMCITGGSPGSLGWGIFDGPTDLASAQAIASWHATAVRIPLNEDCWLGINGVSSSYGGSAYRAAIAGYVSTLHQAGLYVILDLHWSAPGKAPAAAQQAMPDADHAVDFWKSVATAFASDPAVVFDLYNEPYLYTSYMQSPNGDAWACWLNGCSLVQYVTGGNPYTQAQAWNGVGMQTLVDAIRATGATNPIMVGGLDWANDLSGWLAHQPTDPANAIVASWHAYPNAACTSASCRNGTIAPVAAKVPVVIGETGDSVCGATTYVGTLVPWADSLGISYLGWTWNTWSDCQYVLISSYAGKPTSNYGQQFHDLLAVSNP